ncbi:MAG: hypothetical protein RUDDFDWM_001061 [Candidatus Fervidibacterota bacterium]
MVRRFSLSAAVVLLLAGLANAHYLWVTVDNYNPKRGDVVVFRIGLGHEDEFPASDILPRTENLFVEIIQPDGKSFSVDVSEDPATKTLVGKFIAEQEGTYAIVARLIARPKKGQEQQRSQEASEKEKWAEVVKPLSQQEGSGFTVYPIGVIRSPYGPEGKRPPHQGRYSHEVCQIVVDEKFADALKGIENSSHLIVLYWMHKARRDVVASRTPFSDEVFGVFATRSPNRPNPIGICVVELLERKGNVLLVKGLDAFDGTPVVDIKPYSFGIDAVLGSGILAGAGLGSSAVTWFDMSAKALVDVGKPSPTKVRRPPRLDMIILDNSARLKKGISVPVLVLDNGLPTNVTLSATSSDFKKLLKSGEAKARKVLSLTTTDGGLTHLKIDHSGMWLIACQHGNARATLTFAVK